MDVYNTLGVKLYPNADTVDSVPDTEGNALSPHQAQTAI
jgi:hypothetical protein